MSDVTTSYGALLDFVEFVKKFHTYSWCYIFTKLSQTN